MSHAINVSFSHILGAAYGLKTNDAKAIGKKISLVHIDPWLVIKLIVENQDKKQIFLATAHPFRQNEMMKSRII